MKSKTILLLTLFWVFCSFKQDKPKKETFTKTFTAIRDGYVVNSNPQSKEEFYVGGNEYKELLIGWNQEGHAIRAFVSFDISSIYPSDTSKEFTLNSVVLTVYEANTNMLPFSGDDRKNSVNVFLVNYGELEAGDFDSSDAQLCGSITSNGYNVLEDYSLNVTNRVKNQIANHDQRDLLQFRLQFTNDKNIKNPDESDLDGSTWNIFASEEEMKSYVPRLTVRYTISEKDEETD